jgi:hypothetical protein
VKRLKQKANFALKRIQLSDINIEKIGFAVNILKGAGNK